MVEGYIFEVTFHPKSYFPKSFFPPKIGEKFKKSLL